MRYVNIVRRANRNQFLSQRLQYELLETRQLLAYTASVSGDVATMMGDGSGDVLQIGKSAGCLQHNRATAGDSGFASDFDFVSGDGAVETRLVAAAPSSIHISAGGGDDTVQFSDGLGFLNGTINGGDGFDTLDYIAVATPTFTSTGGEALLLAQLGPSAAALAAGRVVGGISGVMFNPGDNSFTIGIEVNGIALNDLRGSSIRLGPAGSGGPVVFDFGDSRFWAESQGVVTRTVVNGTIPAVYAADFLAGNTHLNIETDLFPTGEIQGPVRPAAMPHSATNLAVGGLVELEGVIGGSSTNGMIGGAEDNHFVGGPAFDMLLGRGGSDLLEGGGAFDVLVGGSGADQVFGGSGGDRIVWNNGDGSDELDGGIGSDVVVVNGSAADGDAFELSVDLAHHLVNRTNLTPITLVINDSEQITFNTQSGDDSVLIRETLPELVVAVNGSVGNDSVLVDSNGALAGGNASGLKGALIIDGGVGTNVLILEDSSDTTADIVTVSPNQIGAAAGDTFFDFGGSVAYQRLQHVTVNMPSAFKGDTIHVYPSARTAFDINGNAPLFNAPKYRDTLVLHVPEIKRHKFTRTGQGKGEFTFSNAQSVSFTGIESRKIIK